MWDQRAEWEPRSRRPFGGIFIPPWFPFCFLPRDLWSRVRIYESTFHVKAVCAGINLAMQIKVPYFDVWRISWDKLLSENGKWNQLFRITHRNRLNKYENINIIIIWGSCKVPKNNSKLYRKTDVAKQVKHRYKQKAKQKHDILSIDNSTEQKESIFSKLFPKVRHLLFG